VELALLASSLLAAVFATAGLAKLADLSGSRRAVVAFGVPQRPARLLGTLLPVVELAAAGALVPHRTAPWGALAGLVLLLGFTAAIALNLVRGRAPECRCFGQVHSAPVSWRTAVRNLALAAFAAAVVAGEPARPDLAASGLLAALVAATAVLLVARGSRRREPPAPVEPAGLPLGGQAPVFELPSLAGDTVTLGSLLERGRPVLLVFADAGCGPCRALAPEIAAWQASEVDVTVAVLERGAHATAGGTDEHGRSLVLCPSDDRVAHAYGVDGTPSAVLVDRQGRIASPVAPGAAAIRRLVSLPEPGGDPPAEQGRPLTRFEFVARLASLGLVLAAARAAPALAGATPILAKCKHGPRCGSRCCPNTARCLRRGGRKVCVCPDGREACGSKCCPPTFLCRRTARGKKVCVCPPRTRRCGGRCVPLTDPAHCGECVGGDGSGTGPGGTGACDCPPGGRAARVAASTSTPTRPTADAAPSPARRAKPAATAPAKTSNSTPPTAASAASAAPKASCATRVAAATSAPRGRSSAAGNAWHPPASTRTAGAVQVSPTARTASRSRAAPESACTPP
jgi:peroxiredoxin